MGCDGGTIPKRDELVRQKKKKEEKDKQSELNFRWGHCSITQEPLQKPIVACQLGKLYSKVSVIEALLDKTKLPPTAAHIKNIKDVKDLTLTVNPEYKAKAKTSEVYDDSLAAQYICPIIGLEMAGRFRFVLMWHCGCVMSERAFKEVNDKLCPKCQKPVSADDVIVLNGTEDDINEARTKMLERTLTKKSKKKTKADISKTSCEASTSKNEEVKTNGKASTSKNEGIKANCEASTSKNEGMKTNCGASTSKNENGKAAVVEVSKIKSDEKKTVGNKRQATASLNLADPLFKKTKGDYSVANDPKATEVYKSLFTSHDKAKNQTKAHWVTYNPFYN